MTTPKKAKEEKPEKHILTLRPNPEEWQTILKLQKHLNKKFAVHALMIAAKEYPELKERYQKLKDSTLTMQTELNYLRSTISEFTKALETLKAVNPFTNRLPG